MNPLMCIGRPFLIKNIEMKIKEKGDVVIKFTETANISLLIRFLVFKSHNSIFLLG